MAYLLSLLPVLACPVGMGLMMWMMHGNSKAAARPADHLDIEHTTGATGRPQPRRMGTGEMSTHDHSSYEVMHSGRFVVIDRQGHIQAYIDGRDFDRARMLQTIKQLTAR